MTVFQLEAWSRTACQRHFWLNLPPKSTGGRLYYFGNANKIWDSISAEKGVVPKQSRTSATGCSFHRCDTFLSPVFVYGKSNMRPHNSKSFWVKPASGWWWLQRWPCCLISDVMKVQHKPRNLNSLYNFLLHPTCQHLNSTTTFKRCLALFSFILYKSFLRCCQERLSQTCKGGFNVNATF